MYGISEIGLSDQLDCSEEEAKKYIDGFMVTYPGVARWIKEVERHINEKHYVSTFLGRKRRLYPEMESRQRWLIESAYRMGCNAIIQGSSADQVKLASIEMQPTLKELDMKILLFVHDKLSCRG